jgi:signal-transduction protein with cAMP-binding, CBS, and nucleotidyltransferase domain
MEEGNVNQLPVMEDGQVKGLITREDVLRVLGTDLELRAA